MYIVKMYVARCLDAILLCTALDDTIHIIKYGST